MNILWTGICFNLLKINKIAYKVFDFFKVKSYLKIEGKMIYLESGLDSNSAINSISDFDSASESDSDSDSKSDSSPAFMNLYTHIPIFFCSVFTLF